MPIFEYSCDDCGDKFEQLVRRSADAEAVRCPGCGQDRLTAQYSTFAAHAGSAKSAQPAATDCGSSMCGGGFCGSGACGMNMN